MADALLSEHDFDVDVIERVEELRRDLAPHPRVIAADDEARPFVEDALAQAGFVEHRGWDEGDVHLTRGEAVAGREEVDADHSELGAREAFANAAAMRGASLVWWLSAAAIVNVRVHSSGTNALPRSSALSRCPIACATIGASSSARGVATSPRPLRTTRGSPRTARRRARALLTADWVTLRRLAARVALRSSSTA